MDTSSVDVGLSEDSVDSAVDTFSLVEAASVVDVDSSVDTSSVDVGLSEDSVDSPVDTSSVVETDSDADVSVNGHQVVYTVTTPFTTVV